MVSRSVLEDYLDGFVSRQILMQSAIRVIGLDLRLGLNRRGMTRLIGLDWTGLYDLNQQDNRDGPS